MNGSRHCIHTIETSGGHEPNLIRSTGPKRRGERCEREPTDSCWCGTSPDMTDSDGRDMINLTGQSNSRSSHKTHPPIRFQKQNEPTHSPPTTLSTFQHYASPPSVTTLGKFVLARFRSCHPIHSTVIRSSTKNTRNSNCNIYYIQYHLFLASDELNQLLSNLPADKNAWESALTTAVALQETAWESLQNIATSYTTP
jgi:hypothetical protein